MTFTSNDLMAAAPLVLLLALTCGVLLLDLLLRDEQRQISYVLSIASLLATGLSCIAFRVAAPLPAFNGMLVADSLSALVGATLCLLVAGTLAYSRAYIRDRGLFTGEYFTLVLFATFGMLVMASASHLLTLYLGLELLSLSLYALVALRRDSASAIEAAMKYFVLGALSSGMLLYGMSMIYGATGSLQLNAIADHVVTGHANPTILVFGLVFLVAGLGFKLGVVPFHMWVPDVYDGAPSSVTLLLGSAPKLAGLVLMLRILVEALGAQPVLVEWQKMLVILAVLSLALGNITAIAQTNIKRMLAYSTISHMGFVLLGVLSGYGGGYGAALFYTIVYALTALGAFGMITLLSRTGFEAQMLEDFRGLHERNPWYAFVMLVLMFSLTGIPPTVGFYAKLTVLQAIIGQGYLALSVYAVLLSLVGAFYYLRLVKLMYFDAPSAEAPPLLSTPATRALVLANGLGLLALGVLPGALMDWCTQAVLSSL